MLTTAGTGGHGLNPYAEVYILNFFFAYFLITACYRFPSEAWTLLKQGYIGMEKQRSASL